MKIFFFAKNSIVDVRLASKYASGTGQTYQTMPLVFWELKTLQFPSKKVLFGSITILHK